MPQMMKSPAKRQRRNRVVGIREIEHEPTPGKRPKLPSLPYAEPWHPHVLTWWRDVWRSKLAEEYIRLDLYGLYVCAELYQRFWLADTPKEKRELANEIARQVARYGQSPLDRRRLQIEIKRAETEKPIQRPSQPKNGAEPVDPRRLLSAV